MNFATTLHGVSGSAQLRASTARKRSYGAVPRRFAVRNAGVDVSGSSTASATRRQPLSNCGRAAAGYGETASESPITLDSKRLDLLVTADGTTTPACTGAGGYFSGQGEAVGTIGGRSAYTSRDESLAVSTDALCFAAAGSIR
jgi:hypothetical protein